MAGPCQALTIEGYGQTSEPGWPQLPVKGAMVGIPIQSTPSLTVLDRNSILLPDKFDLCPIAQPVSSIELDGQIHFNGYQHIQDPEAYSVNHLGTEPLVELVSTGYVRS